MIIEGVDVCRLNFSHGSYEQHESAINIIRELNIELNTNTVILVDLQGSKIRCNEMENNGVELIKDETVTITTDKRIGTKEHFSINYKELPRDINPGEKILLDDGKLCIEIISTNKIDTMIGKVVHGGILSSKKGVNLPNTKISLPSLTEKDRKDLDFALKHNVDWVGLSFVRTARDIIELKHLVAQMKVKTKVIAKIEKPERSEEHTSELQSHHDIVCRLLLEKKK